MSSSVTSARYAMGMTFDQYVDYVGTPANLARESGWSAGPKRVDFSGPLREAYTPKLARLADAGGMELRIFTRDGQAVSHGPRANPADAPNADIVNAFLNERDGGPFQSIPVAVFYTNEFRYLYRYIEFPAIFCALHERLVVAPAVGESVAT